MVNHEIFWLERILHCRWAFNGIFKQRSISTFSVGRFYYACFGVARNYYKTTQHKEVPSYNSHGFLIDYFNNSPFYEEREIGKRLQKIRYYRNKSDYGDKFDQANLDKSKNISHELLSMLSNLNENPLYENF